MENVRGREQVEQGKLCERKNGRGVDPNRNWEVHWGFKEKGELRQRLDRPRGRMCAARGTCATPRCFLSACRAQAG